MGDRKYTVSEINRMRQAIEWSYPSGVSYYGAERSAEVEQRLQTYMLNGTEPEELERMSEDRRRIESEMRQRYPGATSVSVSHIQGGTVAVVDVSAKTLGKYQYCTKAPDGMWYADSDFTHGAGVGKPKTGALPNPSQDTPALTAKARAMHEAAAAKTTAKALQNAPEPPAQATPADAYDSRLWTG